MWSHNVVMWSHNVVMWSHNVVMWSHNVVMWSHNVVMWSLVMLEQLLKVVHIFLSSQISALSPLGMETKLKVSLPNSCQSQAAWVERRRERERREMMTSLIPRLSVGGHKSLGMWLGDNFLCTRSSLPPFHFLPLLPTWSQVLEICLEVVVEFQENFKGQY